MFQSLRTFYGSGRTLSENFRRSCLKRLRQEIFKREDEILHALYTDLGKPASEAYVSEIGFVLSEIKFALKNLHRWMKSRRVKTPLMFRPAKSIILPSPEGVVLVMGPWNYPFQLLMTPLTGAVSAGNCVVLKGSRYTPSTAGIIENIIGNCFEPDHCRFIPGDAGEARDLINLKWDHIFFTGSSETGRKIMSKAAEKLIPVTLELGGKNPCIVFNDADLKVSAERIAWGKFLNAGQTCIAPDTVYCHESVYKKFIEILQEVIVSFYGTEAEKSPDYGRIINRHHVKRLASYLDGGGTIVKGGCHSEKNLYFEPTIIEKVPENAPIMKEEIFGPVLPVIAFKDSESLLSGFQDKSRPLALYIFTKNKDVQKRVMQAIPSGSVGINETVKQGANHYLPFGGAGESGMGRYHGKASFDCFSLYKSVMTSGYLGTRFHYPPFGASIKLLKKIFRIFY